jgi:hypothetical protein
VLASADGDLSSLCLTGDPGSDGSTMGASIANTSKERIRLRIEDQITERPTLCSSRLCHNAQADLVRKQQVRSSNLRVGSTPVVRAQEERMTVRSGRLGDSSGVATTLEHLMTYASEVRANQPDGGPKCVPRSPSRPGPSTCCPRI